METIVPQELPVEGKHRQAFALVWRGWKPVEIGRLMYVSAAHITHLVTRARDEALHAHIDREADLQKLALRYQVPDWGLAYEIARAAERARDRLFDKVPVEQWTEKQDELVRTYEAYIGPVEPMSSQRRRDLTMMGVPVEEWQPERI